jgi:hypothetical protein
MHNHKFNIFLLILGFCCCFALLTAFSKPAALCAEECPYIPSEPSKATISSPETIEVDVTCDYDFDYRNGYRCWGAEYAYPEWIFVTLEYDHEGNPVASGWGQGRYDECGTMIGDFRVCCSLSPYTAWW